jgi:hypothetical protein
MPDSPLSESLREAAELYCVPMTHDGESLNAECIENLADDTEDPHTKAIAKLTAYYNRFSCVDKIHHDMRVEALGNTDEGPEETALAIIGKSYYASKQRLRLIHSPEGLRKKISMTCTDLVHQSRDISPRRWHIPYQNQTHQPDLGC